jgi:hypothetical protein
VAGELMFRGFDVEHLVTLYPRKGPK